MIVRNDSNSIPITQTLGYSYQHSKVGTWNNSAGIEIGVETSFKADVPFLASGGVKVSLKGSYSHQWGGSETKVETVDEKTQVTIPPGKKGRVNVVVSHKKMNVKFRYKEKVVYNDGTTETNDKDGVYSNLEFVDVCVPLDVAMVNPSGTPLTMT